MSPNLSDLTVLALDCQATGANPARGHLLEIGWARTSAALNIMAGDSDVQSYLVNLPTDATIPRAVQRITGILDESLKSAVSPENVWKQLVVSAGDIVSGKPGIICPVVIHFARFERPFLEKLHCDNDPNGKFPLNIICTHEIALRLLPDLPRRGLRAIAGYYGHCLPELKRSGDHAVATAIIWKHLVKLLNKSCGVTRLHQLIAWLADTKPAVRTKRLFPMNLEIRRNLPDKPGIYRMLRKGGDLLYIGKAKSLKQRVNSYFRQKAPHAEHTLEMLTQARELKITLTGSALEAAILESDEIKRRSPPYNIALRRRKRQLAFCSRDLERHSTRAGGDFKVGPLPAGKTIEALTAYGWWYINGMQEPIDKDDHIGYSILAVPPDYAPEPNCLTAGFESFREKYHSHLAKQTPLRFLTGLGARLWREKLEAAAREETEEADQPGRDDGDDHLEENNELQDWTPDAVTAAIESMIRRTAHLVRRARWFCLLSESALSWTSIDQIRQKRNLVVFSNGAVIRQGQFETIRETESPPGCAISFRERQNNIDLITYDRLRVLTTELRRIVSEDRNIELCLGPGRTLGRQQLIKALQWV
jgi:DNA polymerase-3 subunit epsilon